MSESQTSLQLPVVDVSMPLSQSSLSSLFEACREWGFFHIVNPGISKELYSKLCSFAREVFGLSSVTKLKLGPSSDVKSYTPRFIASPFYEGLRVSGPDFFCSAQQSAEVLFDHQSSEFSEAMQEYGEIMTKLCKKITQIILMSLGEGFETLFQESEFKNCHGYLRIINYTPPEKLNKDTEGLGIHTDTSCITIIYQDNIGGLQVRSKDGKWMDITPCEDTLVVNIGDMLEAWSNGKLRSSEHRVVLREQRNRLSLAFFWSFEGAKVIYAPNEVVGEENSRMYRPFVCSEYMSFREFSDKEKYEKVGNTVKDFAGIKAQR